MNKDKGVKKGLKVALRVEDLKDRFAIDIF